MASNQKDKKAGQEPQEAPLHERVPTVGRHEGPEWEAWYEKHGGGLYPRKGGEKAPMNDAERIAREQVAGRDAVARAANDRRLAEAAEQEAKAAEAAEAAARKAEATGDDANKSEASGTSGTKPDPRSEGKGDSSK